MKTETLTDNKNIQDHETRNTGWKTWKPSLEEPSTAIAKDKENKSKQESKNSTKQKSEDYKNKNKKSKKNHFNQNLKIKLIQKTGKKKRISSTFIPVISALCWNLCCHTSTEHVQRMFQHSACLWLKEVRASCDRQAAGWAFVVIRADSVWGLWGENVILINF